MSEFITDEMLAAAAVGWRLAHEEACQHGRRCSAHQPIDAAAQKPRLVAALTAAGLRTGPRHLPTENSGECSVCWEPWPCASADPLWTAAERTATTSPGLRAVEMRESE